MDCNGATRASRTNKRGVCHWVKRANCFNIHKTFKSSTNVISTKRKHRTSIKNDPDRFHEQLIDVCNANGIQITYDNTLMGSAIGIGDILLKFAHMKCICIII